MRIIDFWKPKDTSEGERLHERRLIVAFSYANILISAAYILTNIRFGIVPWVNLVQILGSVLTLSVLRFTKSHVPGAHMFLGQAALNIVTLVAVFHGFPYTILMWIPVYSLGAVYLLGVGPGSVWTILTGAMTSAAILFAGGLVKNPIPVHPEDHGSIAVVSVILTGAAAFAASLLFVKSIKKLTQSIERQNEELKAQNATIAQYAQDKSLLVSIVCHDITNPLMLASHYSDKIAEDPGKVSLYIEKVRKGLNAIEAITLAVRDFEAIDSGKMSVKVDSVDLRTIFDSARVTFADRLANKSLTLEFNIPEGVSCMVLAEEASLSNSIVNNLISNAIKFSVENQKIVLSVEEEAECIVLKVRDFGVGMSSERVSHIFDKRHPTTAVGTRGERGTGFGLPITKALMDRFGGQIECQSRDEGHYPDDHGTTFVLRFKKVKGPKKAA